MLNHFTLTQKITDKKVELALKNQIMDEGDIYYGIPYDFKTGLCELRPCAGIASLFITEYYNPNSKYYKNMLLIQRAILAMQFIKERTNSDGSTDLLETNFHDATHNAFMIHDLGPAMLVMRDRMGDEEEEKLLYSLCMEFIEVSIDAMVNLGFHTPNHRWVESAAMALCYNILGWPALMDKINSYLSEGIDCDEYGEFTERSMGSYNPINVNAMMVMAEELGKPELYEYAKRNLELTFFYHEGDGTIFTRNSRRLDSAQDRVYPGHIWYYLYLWAGELFGDAKYLKFADDMFRDSVMNGLGVPACLWLYLDRPQLKTLEPDLTGAAIPDSYHAFYPNSRILRVRKGDFSYTLLSRNPDFMHIKFGRQTMTLRMCSSFFAVAQFEPETIEKTETGYRMTFRGHGEYKGLFPEPPASPDWDKMDHTKRPVIHSCDLDYTLDVTDLEDGVSLHIRVDNTPRVPFKLEFVLPTGVKLETEQVMLNTTPGGELTIKEGDMRVEDMATGSEVTVRGLFAEHTYHRNMRGSIPPRANSFAVYSTDFSPIDRTVEIRFSKRTHARPMHEKL